MIRKTLTDALRGLAVAAAGATGLGGVSAPALAAAATVEEIVVTARRRDESVQAVPVSVTAIAGESFQRAHLASFEESTALTPGFQLAPNSVSPLALSMTMRGSSQGSALITDDPSVGVYVDGINIARPFGIGVDLLDLEDMQILRGPQGTLFGRNATAGAVLLRSNDPDLEDLAGTLSVSGGTDYMAGHAVANVPLGDLFGLRLAYQKRDRDDYVDNVAGDPASPAYASFGTLPYVPSKTTDTEIGGFENETWRAKLRFAPTETLDLVLSYEEFESDLAGPVREQTWIGGVVVDVEDDDDEVSLTFDPRSFAETQTLIFNANLETEFGSWTFIAANREYRNLNEADYDGGDWAAPPLDAALVGAPVPPGLVFIPRLHGSWGRTGGEQDSFELQWASTLLDGRLDLNAGALWFEEEAYYYDYSQGTNIYDPNVAISAGGNWVFQETESIGVYSQGSFRLTDASNLTLGLRYTEDDKRAVVHGTSADIVHTQLPSFDFEAYRETLVSRSGNPAIATPADTFDSLDWLVSYDYAFSDAAMAYVKASTGFRAGGFNGRGLDDPAANFTYQPEELIELEAGLKLTLLDGRMRWNTAVFTNETDDKQFSVLVANPANPNAPPGTNVRNAGKAEATGLETELMYLFGAGWSAAATYGYVDAEIKSLEEFNAALGRVAEVPDALLPITGLVPEHTFSLLLGYERGFDAFNLSATALYAWRDAVDFAGTPPAAHLAAGNTGLTLADLQTWQEASTADAHGIMNVDLTFSTSDNRYSASIWAKNLFDERAQTSSVAFISSVVYQYANATYTEPRIVGLTLSADL